MRPYVRIGVALLACYGAGLLGSLFISIDGWYDSLLKPSFFPPIWVFAGAWAVLYGLNAAALVIVWNTDPHAEDWQGWLPLFFAHLGLNAAWTVFFFGYHAVFIALIDAFVLAVSVALLTVGAWEIDRRAAYLLLPYLAWVFFALVLNGSIWYLN